jgi:transposase
MLNPSPDVKIYLFTGYTDMRKGAASLALMIGSTLLSDPSGGCRMFVFRGKSADKIKILWWDGQGFCLFYKCFDKGKFIWPSSLDKESIGITRAQLSMLLEGVDWRRPKWTSPPEYAG